MLFYFLKIDFQSLETGLQTIVKTQFFYKKNCIQTGTNAGPKAFNNFELYYLIFLCV
jgi:hypothetical protein